MDLEKINLNSQNIDPKVVETYKLLKKFKASSARKDWTKRRGTAWDAIENKMWSDDEKKDLVEKEMVPLVINKCNKGVQGSSAIVTDQKPEVKFHPVGSGDLYVAELLKRAFDFIWTKNQGSDLTYHNVRETKIGGIAFFLASFNRNKGPFGRIMIEEDDPGDIYWSEDSRKSDLSDTAIIRAKLRTKEYIKENYDDITDEDMSYEQITKDEDGGVSSGVEGEDNYTIDTTPADNSDSGTSDKQPKNVWEIEAWIRKVEREEGFVQGPEWKSFASVGVKDADHQKAYIEKNKVESFTRKREKIYHRIIVGKKLVKETINPSGEDRDGDPLVLIVPLMHDRVRKAFPMSPTNYAVDINKEKNKRRAQFIYMASQNANAPIVEPAGAVEWTGNPGTPGSRAKVSKTAPFQITRLPGGTIDVTRFMELEGRSDTDIDDQYDMHDVMRGKLPPGQDNASGRMVLALQDMGGMMSKPFLRALESCLVNLAKGVIALALKHWTRQMWERLLEKKELATWVPEEEQDDTIDYEDEAIQRKTIARWYEALDLIRPTDPTEEPGISLIDLDVKLTAGSSMPTNRIAKSMMAIEKMNAGMYDAQAALEYDDDPNKDKIVARMEKREQAELQAGITRRK